MKTPKGASQEAFFVSRGFAKHSMDEPLSTFPPSAASVQQLCSISAVGFLDAASKNAGHQIVDILFFYPNIIYYIS
jgi:hypothetical protein